MPLDLARSRTLSPNLNLCLARVPRILLTVAHTQRKPVLTPNRLFNLSLPTKPHQ